MGSSDLKPGKLLYERTDPYEYPANEKSSKSVNFDLQGDEGEDYMVYVDMTYNAVPDNSSFKFGLYTSENYFLISSKIADEDGGFATYKVKGGVSLDNALVTSSNPNFYYKERLFTQGANVRIMYYIDRVNRKGSIYINDELQGTINQAYQTEKSLVPSCLLINSTREESISPMTINSVKVYHPKRPANKVTSFRMINRDGTQGAPYSNRTRSTANAAKLYFNCDIDDTTLNTDNIVISDGTDRVDFSIDGYDAANRCVNLNFANHLTKGGQYTVSVSNVKTTDGKTLVDYTTKFEVGTFSELEINNRKFVDSGDTVISSVQSGEVGATLGFVNSTDFDELIKRSVVVFEDGVMTSANEKDITVLKNTDNTDVSNKVTANVSDASNTRISEICTNGNFVPYGTAKSLATETTMTEDVRKIKYTVTNKELANQSVLVDVMYPDKTYSDMVGSDLTSILVYRGQVTLDENGNADIEFRMPSTAGSNLYKAIVNGVQTGGVPYSNINETKDIVTRINQAMSDEEEKDVKITNIENIIKDKKYALNISMDGYDNADKKYISSLIYDYINKNGNLSVEDINSSLDIINTLAAIGCINDGELDSAIDAEKELKLTETRIADFYKQDFATDTLWKKVTSALKGGNYKDKEDFYSKLYEKFVLSVVAKPDGTDNLKAVITEFAEEIFGSDKDVIKNADEQVYRTISNKTFNTYGELKSAFTDAANQKSTTKTGGGGGGGGGKLSNTVPSQQK